jgi:hypothetical protein
MPISMALFARRFTQPVILASTILAFPETYVVILLHGLIQIQAHFMTVSLVILPHSDLKCWISPRFTMSTMVLAQ